VLIKADNHIKTLQLEIPSSVTAIAVPPSPRGRLGGCAAKLQFAKQLVRVLCLVSIKKKPHPNGWGFLLNYNAIFDTGCKQLQSFIFVLGLHLSVQPSSLCNSNQQNDFTYYLFT
jgi:hypothetical protein